MQQNLEKETVEATLRTNEFTFVMPGLSNLNFEIESYFITQGQPWQGISQIECNSEGCTMYVMAGRKSSSETASWFAEAIQPGSAIGCSTIDAMPKELNFAFKGTMSFNFQDKLYTGNDVVIAQGHNTRNNWWIGGPNMSRFTAMPGIAAAAGQNFKISTKVPQKAKVTFMASFDSVHSMQMGVVALN